MMTRTSILPSGWGVLCSLVLAANAGAAEAPPRGVRDTVTVLPGVRVDGQREDLAGTRSTGTVQRLSRADVTRFLPSTSADALLAAPGVELVKTGPWASRVSFRGLSGERVMVLVDGVRLDTGRGHGGQTSLVSIERLEGVELLPGAGGAQFGSGALGGVVNLVTQRPLMSADPSLGLTLQARASDPGGERRENATLRWRTPRAGLELAGGFGRLAGLATPAGLVDHSSSREDEWSGRGAVRAGALQADFEHTSHAAHDVGLPAFGVTSTANGVYPLQARDADRLELRWGRDPAVPRLRLLAVEQRFRSHFDETSTDTTFRFGRPIAFTSNAAADRVRVTGRSLQPRWRIGTAWNLVLDGEYRHDRTDGPRTTESTTRNSGGAVTSERTVQGESVPPAWREGFSAALHAKRGFGRLQLEAGVRADRFVMHADSTEVSFTSELTTSDARGGGELGAAWRMGAWSLYAHTATGFRVPNLEERYYNNDIHGGLRLFGNPGLRPERSHSVEAGLRAEDALGGALAEARLSAYRSDVDDLITFRYLGQLYLIPRFQYANVDRARIEGVELSTRWRIGRGSARVHAALPRGVDRESGDPLADVGAARVTLDLAGPLFARHPVTWAVRGRWSDRIEDPQGTLTRPAFTTYAAELAGQWFETRVTLALRNLTNHRYRELLSFIEEPGRTVAVSVRRDFDWRLEPRKGIR